MSVATTMTRFATVWKNYSLDSAGQHIEMVFDRIPRLLYPAHLPAVLVFPGAGTYNYDQYGENIVAETRSYRCVIAVSQATLGNMETGEIMVEPYFDSVRDYFVARPGLEDDNASEPQDIVCQARPTGDSGYFIFEYPAGLADGEGLGLFHAVDFTFEVKELASITYKD